MTQYEGRSDDLKNKINKHLSKLTEHEKDYFATLKQHDLMELKTVFADINNLLTFQMTIAAVEWICGYFSIAEQERIKIIEKVDKTKPNSNGFDIDIKEPYPILGEVKCTSPVNNGEIFGAAQHDSILNDVLGLIEGKGGLDTKNSFKFLFLVDLEGRTKSAIAELIRQTKGKSVKAEKYNAVKRNKIVVLTNEISFNNLDINKVYIKALKIR
jgi:hypothetical protein